ncbi:MAG: glycosyltransferase [Alphaproteobacteria bacterium]|nr:glycosyltransferase [Alphaproteobacteria bacterium]
MTAAPRVTVLVPNYRTPELTRLCLRLLRKHTPAGRIAVVVIDNDSRDASTDYLRALRWITLIERPRVAGEKPWVAHARALDLAMTRVATPYVLSIHTDTLVRDAAWLDLMLAPLEADAAVAGAGSWKLEVGGRPWWRRALKAAERQVQLALLPLLGRGHGKIEGHGENYLYLRSHCAMYRTEALRRHGLSFAEGELPAGKAVHRRLEEAGYRMVFLDAEALGRHVLHVNNATMVLNAEFGGTGRFRGRGMRRIEQALALVDATAVLADDRLDA